MRSVNLLLVLFFALSFELAEAQFLFNSQNIRLVSLTAPNTTTVEGNKYSGCWGWYQASKHREYAISGSSNGTYFIDITNPSTPVVCAFVPGKQNCVWREMKTYQHYCYIISDDPFPNRFQIVDMQYLPDSVVVVHNNNTIFERGHTIWIDKDRMYIASTTFSTSEYKPMAIFSLADPVSPQLVRTLEHDIPNSLVAAVHDMYVRNDTIYCSAAYQGLYLLYRQPSNDSLIVLGSYVGYPTAGYNHSSFLTQNGKYLVFCDEVPASKPIHLVDVENFGNVQPLNDFHPNPLTTPHNPYIIGNKWLIASCYKDGLYIYDISSPPTVKQVGFFDTYPQGGNNTGDYGDSPYNGNWGAYPFLPSGLIVANDMTNGVFVLDPTNAFASLTGTAVGVRGIDKEELGLFPNPSTETVKISSPEGELFHVTVTDATGRCVLQANATREFRVDGIPSGWYTVTLRSIERIVHQSIVIQH